MLQSALSRFGFGGGSDFQRLWLSRSAAGGGWERERRDWELLRLPWGKHIPGRAEIILRRVLCTRRKACRLWMLFRIPLYVLSVDTWKGYISVSSQ